MHFRPTLYHARSLARSLAALSGHCHLCSLSRVRHATPHISARPFAPHFFFFSTSLLRWNGSNCYARNAETAWDKCDAILIGFISFSPSFSFLKYSKMCRQSFALKKSRIVEIVEIVEMIHALKISRNEPGVDTWDTKDTCRKKRREKLCERSCEYSAQERPGILE